MGASRADDRTRKGEKNACACVYHSPYRARRGTFTKSGHVCMIRSRAVSRPRVLRYIRGAGLQSNQKPCTLSRSCRPRQTYNELPARPTITSGRVRHRRGQSVTRDISTPLRSYHRNLEIDQTVGACRRACFPANQRASGYRVPMKVKVGGDSQAIPYEQGGRSPNIARTDREFRTTGVSHV